MERKMKMAFVGTRAGMLQTQVDAFRYLLRKYQPSEFHHRMNTGADAKAHEIVKLMFRHGGCIIHGHPSTDPSLMDRFITCSVMHEPKDYLAQDHELVNVCDLLVVARATDNEQKATEGWSIIEYARHQQKPLCIIRRFQPGTIVERMGTLSGQVWRCD